MKPQDRITTLTKRREFLESELDEARRFLERAQRQYEKVEAALLQNEIEIDEFRRECLNSPKLDTLPIERRILKALKENGITTIYELRYSLRDDKYIRGVGDLNKMRLAAILRMHDTPQTA